MTSPALKTASLDEISGVEVGPAPDPDVELIIGEPGLSGRRPTRGTLLPILRYDPRWEGRIRYNTFQETVELDGEPISDAAITLMSCWIETVYQAAAGKEVLYEVANCVAMENLAHPVQEYLSSLQWDEVERLPLALVSVLGAEDTPLHREMSRAFFVGAVARAFAPGCKLDTMLVLIGDQGLGKSRFCQGLVPEPSWFSDTLIDLGSKDAYIALRGKWIYEMAEMDALRKRASTRVKAFLTSATDTYRAPYQKTATEHPRHCVFIGTSNELELFSDGSGNRRYWPLEVRGVDLEALVAARDQLWAEAVTRYRRGETWYLSKRFADEQREAALQFQISDPWREALAAWIARRAEPFSINEAISGSLGISLHEVDRRHQTKFGPMLSELGCIKKRQRQGSNRTHLWFPPHDEQESGP